MIEETKDLDHIQDNHHFGRHLVYSKKYLKKSSKNYELLNIRTILVRVNVSTFYKLLKFGKAQQDFLNKGFLDI